MKELLLANQAIARGAWEAGVTFAAGYPGTPSTEILETLRHFPGVHARWSTNEKVAFDEGMGAAIGGLRVLVTMKHVGLNVAADSFMVFPYSGTNGGFVVVSADDPGMHSSQNEQDNRFLALMAKVPIVEPTTAQECKDYVGIALDLSEEFSVPVMMRTTTRLAHHKGLVELDERAEGYPVEVPQREFTRLSSRRDPPAPDPKRFSVPIYRRLLRPRVEERLQRLTEYAETSPLNRVEHAESETGAVTSGICYTYVKEVLPEAGVLCLGLTHPLPPQLLKDFCARYRTVYVVEEGEGFIENQLRAMGITNLVGKELFGNIGEYSPGRLAAALGRGEVPKPLGGAWRGQRPATTVTVLPRPPMFCVGCGHRTVFSALRQLRVTVAGDIGCYTMGALPPYEAEHTTFCMGASIGTAVGLERAGHERTVAIIGDSTFFHAGIPPLIDAVVNGSQLTLVILDNSTTGMTGGQPHSGSGQTISGEAAPAIDIPALVKAIGIKHVETVDTWDRKGVTRSIRKALAHKGPAVVIARGLCVQLPEMKYRDLTPYYVDESLCTQCDACFKVWCPAITRTEDNFPAINPTECTACTVCAQVCPTDAIYLWRET